MSGQWTFSLSSSGARTASADAPKCFGDTGLAVSHGLRQPWLLGGGKRGDTVLGHGAAGGILGVMRHVVRGLRGIVTWRVWS